MGGGDEGDGRRRWVKIEKSVEWCVCVCVVSHYCCQSGLMSVFIYCCQSLLLSVLLPSSLLVSSLLLLVGGSAAFVLPVPLALTFSATSPYELHVQPPQPDLPRARRGACAFLLHSALSSASENTQGTFHFVQTTTTIHR